MRTRISFSRERIKANIQYSRDLLAGRPPAVEALPPIRVTDGKQDYWTFGMKLFGEADVFYEPRPRPGRPSLFIETSRKTRMVSGDESANG